ncbi:calmodulin-beta-like isoform X2 [Lineus longissimus]|uniref:calmodulin-beta-like isoform X2 n=1 Tax=Lineus longissimus TaxID=88925 RepID=UPI002B4DC6A4
MASKKKKTPSNMTEKDMKKRACELGLTQKQISEYKEAFKLVDKDDDGRITTAELYEVMSFLKNSVSQEQVEVMIDQADIDGNGTVEFDEFLKMMARRQREEPKSSDDEMREFFRVFDRDGNGFIDAQELRYTMKHLGEQLTDAELKDMIKAADLDGDGKINYEEFIRMMQVKQGDGNKQ